MHPIPRVSQLNRRFNGNSQRVDQHCCPREATIHSMDTVVAYQHEAASDRRDDETRLWYRLNATSQPFFYSNHRESAHIGTEQRELLLWGISRLRSVERRTVRDYRGGAGPRSAQAQLSTNHNDLVRRSSWLHRRITHPQLTSPTSKA